MGIGNVFKIDDRYITYTFICHLFVYQLRPIQIDTPLCNNGKLSPLGTIKLVLAAPLVKE
jgi:hypothetical protein